jgi:hypothetical protein
MPHFIYRHEEGERMREERKRDICPRCGQIYSYLEKRTVGSNTYYYAVHVIGRGKERKKRKCYLGPEKHIYGHGSISPPQSEINREQLAQYLPEIIEELEKAKEDPEILTQLGLDIEVIGKLAGKLLRLVNTLKRRKR